MQINGVAHTFITVGNFAAARAFYEQLLPFMGLAIVADTANTFYCAGGRTGFGIYAPAAKYAGQRFRLATRTVLRTARSPMLGATPRSCPPARSLPLFGGLFARRLQ